MTVPLLHQTRNLVNIAELLPLLLAVGRSQLTPQAELGGVPQERHLELPPEAVPVAVEPDHDLPRVLVDGDRVVVLGAHSPAAVRPEEPHVAVANSDARVVPVGVLWADPVPANRPGHGRVVAPEVQAGILDGHADPVIAAVVGAVGTPAGGSGVPLEALADTGGPVADSGAGALDHGVGGVGRVGLVCPGGAGGAGSLGAVYGEVPPGEAAAHTVCSAGAVEVAGVWAGGFDMDIGKEVYYLKN